MNDKDYKVVHETVIRDLIDIFDLLNSDDSDRINKFLKKKKSSIKSIASATSDLTLVFPVICSKNISIENAAMTAKAIERKCVSMLRILFSAIQLSDKDAASAFDYIKQFHTNLSTGIGIDDIIKAADSLGEATQFTSLEEAAVAAQFKEAWNKDKKNLDYYLPDNVSEASMMSYSVRNTPNGDKVFAEVNITDPDAPDYSPKAAWMSIGKSIGKTVLDTGMDIVKDYAHQKADNKFSKDFELYKRDLTAVDREKKDRLDASNIRKNDIESLNKQVIDNDIKKANELMPTNMVVSFKTTVPSKDGSENIVDYTNVVIGVKAKLYYVDSNDMINRIITKTNDRNVLTKFIRATTREISFWRDFVFAIDRAKIDALSYSKRGSSSKLWKVLERRALKSKIRRASASLNDATAISTMVVSQEEVELIKKNQSIDLEKVSVARGIMDAYNFMGICIIDENLEVAKFIFDTGDDNWENLAFSSLEKESSDNTYKKVVNLMTKIR